MRLLHPIHHLGVVAKAALGLAFLLPGIAVAEPYAWSNVAFGGGGFVAGLVTCPTKKGLIFVRTDVGGAYRWNDTTQAWLSISDWATDAGNLGTEALAVDPQSPNKVYMLLGRSDVNGGNTLVARSTDYGTSFATTNVTSQFKAHGNGMGRQTGERLAVDPNQGNTLFTGTRWNGIFKSTDGAVSWTHVSSFNVTTTPNNNGTNLVLFDKSTGTPGSPTQTIYAGVSRVGSSNFYVSKDGGATWNSVAGAPTNLMPQRASLASDGTIYLSYADGAGPNGSTSPNEPMTNGAIYHFDPKAGTWSNITPTTGHAYGGVSVDASNSQRVLVTTTSTWSTGQTWTGGGTAWGDDLFLTTDAGKTWTDLFGSKKINLDANGTWITGNAIHWAGSVEIDPFNPNRAFVTSGNGIFSTTALGDGSAASTWKFTVAGLEETVPLDIVSLSSGQFAAVVGDYDGYISSDLTKPAPRYNPGIGTTYALAAASSKPSYIARSGSALYTTSNTGSSWTKGAGSSTGGKLAYSADGSSLLWAAGGSVSRSTNNGSSWTTSSGVSGGVALAGDYVNSNKIYAFNGGSFYVSTNGGASFSSAGSPGSGGKIQIRTTPGVEGDVWVAMDYGGLQHTTNSGQSFSKIAGVSAATCVGLGKAAPGSTYPAVYIWGTMGGTTGIFRSIDAGANWTRINDNLHQYGGPGDGQSISGDLSVYGRVFMTTAGLGVIYGQPSGASNVEGRNAPASDRLSRRGLRLTGLPGQPLVLVDIQGRQVLSALAEPQGATVRLSGLSAGLYVARSGHVVETVLVR